MAYGIIYLKKAAARKQSQKFTPVKVEGRAFDYRHDRDSAWMQRACRLPRLDFLIGT